MSLSAQPLLKMSGSTKTFPGAKALKGEDFDLLPGAIKVAGRSLAILDPCWRSY